MITQVSPFSLTTSADKLVSLGVELFSGSFLEDCLGRFFDKLVTGNDNKVDCVTLAPSGLVVLNGRLAFLVDLEIGVPTVEVLVLDEVRLEREEALDD